ncbi:MAG: hypothetical protein ACLFQS_11175 [Bacteroidales bacterium]
MRNPIPRLRFYGSFEGRGVGSENSSKLKRLLARNYPQYIQIAQNLLQNGLSIIYDPYKVY